MGMHAEKSSAFNKNILRNPVAYLTVGVGGAILSGMMVLNNIAPEVEGEHLPSPAATATPYSTQYSEYSIEMRGEALRSPDVLRELGVCASELQAELDFEKSQASTLGNHAGRIIADTRKGLRIAKEAGLVACPTDPNLSRSVKLHTGGAVYRKQVTRYRSQLWCGDRSALTNDAQDGIIRSDNQFANWLKAGDAVFRSCHETA